MTKKGFMAIFVILLASGCATIAEKSRMEKFNETAENYQRMLMQADYRAAAGFIDPEGQMVPIDFDRYKDIKIVAYDIIHSEAEEQGHVIRQEVALQYFSLSRNLVKTIDYRPVWRFREDRRDWYLTTSLPLADAR